MTLPKGRYLVAVLPKASRYDDVFYCMKQGPGKSEGMAHLRNQGGSFSKEFFTEPKAVVMQINR